MSQTFPVGTRVFIPAVVTQSDPVSDTNQVAPSLTVALENKDHAGRGQTLALSPHQVIRQISPAVHQQAAATPTPVAAAKPGQSLSELQLGSAQLVAQTGLYYFRSAFEILETAGIQLRNRVAYQVAQVLTTDDLPATP